MTAFQYNRGHKIYYDYEQKRWLYSDDDTPAEVERPCVRCGHMPLETGEDYCLGHLDKVEYACCGHGVEQGYIKLDDGRRFVLQKDFKDED